MVVTNNMLRMGCKRVETCAPKCPMSLYKASELMAAVRAAKPIKRVLNNVLAFSYCERAGTDVPVLRLLIRKVDET